MKLSSASRKIQLCMLLAMVTSFGPLLPLVLSCDIFSCSTWYLVFNPFIYYFRIHAGGRHRHAFIGIGFRERTEAYDFQAALHDHMNYLNKKKTTEEMEQQFQNTSTVDYILKEGETIVLQLKNTHGGGSSVKSKASELGIGKLSLADKGNQKDPILSIKPPPPPPESLSPVGSPL
ncbi:uncharacterized protein At1g03900-like [Hibiscus syriacus]|uniref:uncharacterized protein At1g03900-like n=1 Tax=Hibiscus syriacus TaxID=106335 RepID=UPI0019249E75|nr:uncharacterized protein At1g03900-like [Hibiscus syriacus]